MSSPTFTVSVSGVGNFVFRRRTIRDQLRIEAEASRILGGPVLDAVLVATAHAVATVGVLLVQGPDGWTLDDIDPLDPVQTQQVFEVHRSLRVEEGRFRRGAAA